MHKRRRPINTQLIHKSTTSPQLFIKRILLPHGVRLHNFQNLLHIPNDLIQHQTLVTRFVGDEHVGHSLSDKLKRLSELLIRKQPLEVVLKVECLRTRIFHHFHEHVVDKLIGSISDLRGDY